jgi:uncharacterized protein YktB (UPF0637 family)
MIPDKTGISKHPIMDGLLPMKGGKQTGSEMHFNPSEESRHRPVTGNRSTWIMICTKDKAYKSRYFFTGFKVIIPDGSDHF